MHTATRRKAPRGLSVEKALLIAMLFVELFLLLWGIRRDLPFLLDSTDEHYFVRPAIHIAATCDLNPHWFGHPGSTVLYPLALLFHVEYSLSHNVSLRQCHGELETYATEEWSAFYLWGRTIPILYALASLPVLFLLARRLLSRGYMALAPVWLLLTYPPFIHFARIIRTDSAGIFFSLLAILALFRLTERPTMTRTIVAGCMIGFGISTRFFLVALFTPLFVVLAMAWWQKQLSGSRACAFLAISIGAAVITFALTTPFLFLDWNAALVSILREARPSELGTNLFTPMQNMLWHLWEALPSGITWLQLPFAIAGMIGLLSFRPNYGAILGTFMASFLLLISIHPLHSYRWTVALLPFIACTVSFAIEYAQRQTEYFLRRTPTPLLHPIIILCISLAPLSITTLSVYSETLPSTQLLARQWVLHNVRPGARIAEEIHSTWLGDVTDFRILESVTLARAASPEWYKRKGFEYLIVSSSVYNSYLASPGHYPDKTAFYEMLFRKSPVASFTPSSSTRGPTILIYDTKVL